MKEFFSSKYQAGYPGEDSQRSKAERMFREETHGLDMNVPQSHSSKAQQKMRLYADGGHAEDSCTDHGHPEGKKMAMGGQQSMMRVMPGMPRGYVGPVGYRQAPPVYKKGGHLSEEHRAILKHLKHLEKMEKEERRHHHHRAEGGKMAFGGLFDTSAGVVNKKPAGAKMARGGEAMRRGGHKHAMPDYQTNEHFPRRAKAPRLNVERFQEVEHRAEGGRMAHGAEVMRRGGHRSKKHFGFGGLLGSGPEGMMEMAKNIASGVNQNRIPMPPIAPPAIGKMARGGEAMRRGGHRHKKHYSIGGALSGIFGGLPGTIAHAAGMADGGRAEGGKLARGGEAMRRGGHRRHHAEGGKAAGGSYARGGNVYEREMVGEHPSHSRPHFNYESDMKGERCVRHSYAEGGKATGGKMAMGGVGKIRHNQATRSGQPINRKVNKDRTHY